MENLEGTNNKKVKTEESYVEKNPMDSLPETIDKDYGFFMMFGEPDLPIPGTASNNFESIRSTRELGL